MIKIYVEKSIQEVRFILDKDFKGFIVWLFGIMVLIIILC